MLHDYMLKKVELIKSVDPTMYDFYTLEDQQELQSWDYITTGQVSEHLLWLILTKKAVSDEYLCPWCIQYIDNDCMGCQYGERHGICTKEGSDYKKAVYAIQHKPSFTALLEKVPNAMQQLVNALLKQKPVSPASALYKPYTVVFNTKADEKQEKPVVEIKPGDKVKVTIDNEEHLAVYVLFYRSYHWVILDDLDKGFFVKGSINNLNELNEHGVTIFPVVSVTPLIQVKDLDWATLSKNTLIYINGVTCAWFADYFPATREVAVYVDKRGSFSSRDNAVSVVTVPKTRCYIRSE